jgi:N-acetylglucosamine-6-phosphate deacetylase
MNVAALGPQGFGTYDVEWTAEGPVFTAEPGDPELMLIPGFVDIHFHGAFGIDFMSATTEQMGELVELLIREGYETVLPTTVTASTDDISAALSHLPDHPMIGGFHLEGPFISPKFPGAQPQGFIVDPPTESSEWDAILDDPRLRVITLAGERPGALDLIERLDERGVRVSLGHTDASAAEARAAIDAGAKHTTHTYNAMRGLHHRDVGMLGTAMIADELMCELIYDRLHVSEQAALLLMMTKGIENVIAVSDSTMATGLAEGTRLTMWGLECLVGRDEVRLLDGTLAGSGITLYTAFKNLCHDFGPEAAIRLCCVNPRAALNLSEIRVWLEIDANLDIVRRHHVRYNF